MSRGTGVFAHAMHKDLCMFTEPDCYVAVVIVSTEVTNQ